MSAENIGSVIAQVSPSEDESHDSHMADDRNNGILDAVNNFDIAKLWNLISFIL